MITTYRVLFLLSPAMALVLLSGFLSRNPWHVVLGFFIILPIIDTLLSAAGLPSVQTPAKHPLWDRVLALAPWINGVTWLVALAASVWVAPQVAAWGGWALLGWGIRLGVVGGSLGITTAHELIHRPNRAARLLGGVVLSSVAYGAFKIEHVRGHHLRVATFDDPATARRGESLYVFLPRAIIGVITHAFALEAARLKRAGKSAWNLENEFLGWLLLTVAFFAAAYGVSGGVGLFVIAMSSSIAILLLEIVDYIEHYGITREPGEPVSAAHSWDFDSPLTSAFLINLQRHADHHAHGGKPFQRPLHNLKNF